MLFLEGPCKIVADTLVNILTGQNSQEQAVKVGDFHGSSWCVYYAGGDEVWVALQFLVELAKLKDWGMVDLLHATYGKADVAVGTDLPEDLRAYTVGVRITEARALMKEELSKQEQEACAAKAAKAAGMYLVCMTAVFKHAFDQANAGKTFAPYKVPYREDEGLYLGASKDNLCVYTSIVFESDDDLLFGRIFLQEFVDAKKHERSIAAAPGCDMSIKRPKDLAQVKGVEAESAEKKGPYRLWITLILQVPRHTDTKPETLGQTVEYLLNFRNYVQYHIKCAKTFMNQKMRARHADLLKVLARAKTDQTGQATTRIE
eukprot:TRINITY_DN56506_c0_g1_i1.p2 TRINITY_DN56506_c0_g1~~TRINITY_DN56506_c0_g1_i1.p2  ORF type:complete len:317 (+),score=113.58 TRINITY_DN56506_c0_g1_i1:98-1048(+)